MSITFRYFDCRGRAQATRDALALSGLPFVDDRVAISPAWREMKEGPAGGPFGSLPVLEWEGDVVAQALPIASYLARRLGEHDERDATGSPKEEEVLQRLRSAP